MINRFRREVYQSMVQRGDAWFELVGHRYSWLSRVVSQRPSWCMPQDVERVKSSSTDSEVAAAQVNHLDEQDGQPKVVAADSLYCNKVFLEAILHATTVDALVRVRSNCALYEDPPVRQPNQLGRPRKHGAKLQLKEPQRPPDRTAEMNYWGQRVRLQAWHGLHFCKVPLLVGLLLMVEFLKADGSPRYQRPLYLFWTGPETVPLSDLCRIYLWRFAIEHLFRFLKQHLGLNTSRSPDPKHHERWVWSCALAAAQLVLIRHHVAQLRPPWQRSSTGTPQPATLTARQTQRNAFAFLRTLVTPTAHTRTVGKGRGRPFGYHPKPRTRHPVITKANSQTPSG